MRLLASGKNDYAVARELGIPRSTIYHRRRDEPLLSRPDPDALAAWRPDDAEAYCYVLGLYLGDGHVAAPRGHPVFRLSLDGAYPEIIESAVRALEQSFPGITVRRYVKGDGAWVVIQVSWAGFLHAFPQHGPGKKHERPIVLADWQRDLTTEHPGALIRGLIHSDGCRCINRFKTKLPSGRVAEYEYPRYFFSNLSADIRAIFCEHCDLLGIRYTCGHKRNVSIAHKASVAILEELVGAKK
jgi:hypothetical protein